MAPQLSTRAIDLVIRLCEQQRAEIAGHVLRMHFGGVGDELIAAGALVEMAPSETVFMPIDLDDQAVAFEWEPDLHAHAVFHPADGWVHADEHARRRYRLDFPWLLRVIAQQLRVPVATRPASLVPDHSGSRRGLVRQAQGDRPVRAPARADRRARPGLRRPDEAGRSPARYPAHQHAAGLPDPRRSPASIGCSI